MKQLAEMTNDELKERAQSLCDAIYNLECFGTKDMVEYEAILAELERRGIKVMEQKVLAFPEATEEDEFISEN
jgi:hypothetical protein